MSNTFLFRLLTDNERNNLHEIMLDDKESAYKAKIILLKDDIYAVSKIRRATDNRDDVNIRK
jgi:hypothetical protein